MNKRMRGFTIVEVLVALAIAGILGTMVVRHSMDATTKDAVAKAQNQSMEISIAAKKYRIDRTSWPVNLTELVTRGYLTAPEIVPPFGGSYGYNIINDSNGGHIRLTTPMNTQRRAQMLAGVLPGGQMQGLTSASTIIRRAGMEVALEGLRQEVYQNFYQVDGMTNIRGDVDFRGFNALNLNNVYARAYYDLDDPDTVLDPSHTSVINELIAQRVEATLIEGEIGRFEGSVEAMHFHAQENVTGKSFQADTLQVRDGANISKLTLGSASAGAGCTVQDGNIAVSGGEVLTCNGGIWQSNRLKFGGQSRNAIAAAVVGTVWAKGSTTVCRGLANGWTIVETWSGSKDHESVTGAGAVVPVGANGSVSFSSYGDCQAFIPSIVGYFYY